jgi:chemotaxis protein methyltransferase CheR
MAPEDFQFLARLLRRRSGLLLTLDKRALLARRLEPVMRRFDFKDMGSLIVELRAGREALAEAVTEAMTVNESSFFRDPALFVALRDTVLPRLIAARAGDKRLRIWSAAAAAGQEAYSIAILLTEMGLAREGWSIELIATDLSGEAIVRAQAGCYAGYEIERGLDAHAMRYFRRDRDDWLVDASLRRMITFRRFNLLDSFGWLDDLDMVFCRNVLMYFDRATRLDVLARIAETMATDGLLVLGDNEAPEGKAFSENADGPWIYSRPRSLLARVFRRGQFFDIEMESLFQGEFAAQRGMQHHVGEDQPAGARRKADCLMRAGLLKLFIQLGRVMQRQHQLVILAAPAMGDAKLVV